MKEFELNELLNNAGKVDEKIGQYMDKKVINKLESQKEILGHMAKAEHNLNFVSEIKDDYNDWTLVACYYAAYHMALALILTKGYFSKNHDATLCVLIKYFYKKELSEDDFRLLNSLDTEDILFYVQSKQEREKASYSSRILFDKSLVSEMKLKTRLFVNKAKGIIEDNL